MTLVLTLSCERELTLLPSIRPLSRWKFFISKFYIEIQIRCSLHVAPYFESEFRKIDHVLYCKIVTLLVCLFLAGGYDFETQISSAKGA